MKLPIWLHVASIGSLSKLNSEEYFFLRSEFLGDIYAYYLPKKDEQLW
jgi:hypothetical protein